MNEEQGLPAEQVAFYQWLEQVEPDPELANWIAQLETVEPPQFAPEELERLETLGREYAQELFDREAIPDLPPMEPDLLPEHEPDRDRGR
jgi:hypothetical protein